jgi:hypothetical protein
LDELVSNLPKDVFHEDDLGGGIYVPFGIGSICQNSKPGKYQRWNKHQVPYTRNETHYMQNYKVFELYGKIMGEIACAIFDIFPSIYKQNQERYHDAEDCCYPTPGMQFSAKNKDKFWFAHQAIIRVIGKPFGEMFGEMLKIALHADESDAPGIQMLSFLPMGGEDGCGGHVEGTDLLVFRDRTGGPCYRLNTTVRDTVVVILFNGKNQLHGGAVDRNCTRELRMENNLFRYYTTRIVHYLRGPAEEFTKARATYSGSDAPVVFVRSSPPSGKKHIPICKETIQYNQLVILPWGKEKKMEKAKLRIENDTMHFFFETGGEFYGNRNVYDPKCISKETCECWWFPG